VVRLQTPFSAVHSVLERVQMPVEMGIQANWVVATNVYLKTPLGWRMVAHHASPAPAPQAVTTVTETEAKRPPKTLH
jgi:hypothetical protein